MGRVPKTELQSHNIATSKTTQPVYELMPRHSYTGTPELPYHISHHKGSLSVPRAARDTTRILGDTTSILGLQGTWPERPFALQPAYTAVVDAAVLLYWYTSILSHQ